MTGPVYAFRDRRADGFKPDIGLRRDILTSKMVVSAAVIDRNAARNLRRAEADLRYREQEAVQRPPMQPDDFRDFYIDRNPDFDASDLIARDAKRRADSSWPGPAWR